jgi:hypothetical protein
MLNSKGLARGLLGMFILLAVKPAMGAPEVHSGALFDYLLPQHATFTKRIRNLGDLTAFVRVETAEIRYDEQGMAREVALTGDTRDLIASPSRLIIPPGSSRDLRLVFRGARAQERYFRLRFVPVVPHGDDPFGQPEQAQHDYLKAIEASVGVLKAVGGIVLISPKPSMFATLVQQQGASLSVSNNGNTTIVLEDLTPCQANALCPQGRTVHIRPGKVFTYEGEQGQGLSFTLVEGTQRRRYAP